MNVRILYAACPLCGCSATKDIISADCSRHPLYQNVIPPVMRWKQCVQCGHVFTEGYFTEAACNVIFSKTNEHQQVGFDMERQRIVSSRIIEKVLPYVNGGNWLDIGFGNGSLLFTAQEYGFTPIGADLRPDNVSAMKALGIQAHLQDVAGLVLAERCAVISMADVLEHMPYPGEVLKAVSSLLEVNGVLFISMPNMESMVWRASEKNKANPYWGELEHYHNFSRSRLYALLLETGFEPLRYGISERYRLCMEVIARRTEAKAGR